VRQKKDSRDYGWRLHGQAVGVLPDRSFDLAGNGRGGEFLAPYCPDAATLQSCLQCGACTASCGLADRDSLFPRRQMTFVRLGLQDRLAADPDIWHCYGCNECSTSCPSGVRPGRVMGALRQLATERFAPPRAVGRLVNDPRRAWLVYAAAAVVLAVLVALRGAFVPAAGPIRYDGMLPDQVVTGLFGVLSGLVVVGVAIGCVRAWRAWFETPPWAAGLRILGRATLSGVAEILAHKRFVDCEERRGRAWIHRSVMGGFLGLLIGTAIVALGIPLGLPYPLSAGDPVKVAGNLFAVLLVGGTGGYLVLRVSDHFHGQASPFFDWLFVVNLLLIGLTGVATEVLRLADVRAAAYPTYFVHLVFVCALIATLPYSKLIHAMYRVLAVVGRRVDELAAAEHGLAGRRGPGGSGRESRDAVGVPLFPRTGSLASSPAAGDLLRLGQRGLSAFSDATLSAAYYRFRDVEEVRGGRRRFPNIRRLHGSALEREKDRREVRALVRQVETPEAQDWYEDAVTRPCAWWITNHLVARHALTSCMACGMCTSVCPAAEHYEEYDPRDIVDAALSGDEERLVAMLRSDLLWYCTQCGSCTGRCPRENSVMSLVTSLRLLAQLKGYHVDSVRGRQQYAARHLWGGNLWNRAFSIYFRDPVPEHWRDFGPRYARAFGERDEHWERVGASPDMEGDFAGRKVDPATLKELRACIRAGGALYLWDRIEEHGAVQARELGLDLDEYHHKVSTEG
jgi:quinone-modifying oxidoreductase, subunit QmoC